jgi:small subunit ribosomal protein S9
MAQYYEGVGRRKESTARVRVASGTGTFTVNTKGAEEYFPRVGDMEAILLALQAAEEERSRLDITAVVNGGGVSGQADAVKMGLARALLLMKPDLKAALRKAGTLTRDARVKERKKPGLKRARKAPTYTKR